MSSFEDYEDNNPFAEPSENVDTRQPIAPEADAFSGTTSSTQVTNSGESTTESKDAGENLHRTDTDLKRLLPERFSARGRISIRLLAIEKHKVNNPILRFDVTVRNLPRFKQPVYTTVRRTYTECTRFNKYLAVSNLECFVPVIPNACTSFPRGGDEEMKHLMSIWQEWFDRITKNPILVKDDEFVFFVENNFGYSVINTQRKTSIASGLVRKTLKQLALPPDPYPDLAEFRPLIKSLYVEFTKLNKQIEAASKARKQMSIHIYDASNRLATMAQNEVGHRGMQNLWEKFLKVNLVHSDLALVDSISDMATWGDGVASLVADFYEIKEALTNRYLIMRELAQADANAILKRQAADRVRNKVLLDTFKVDEAVRALQHAEQAHLSLTKQVQRLSGEMQFEKKEVIEFVGSKCRQLAQKHVLAKVHYHRRLLKQLELIRVDVRLVDTKGGLSRLNRDHLAPLAPGPGQLQLSSGDAWLSRTFRLLETTQNEEDGKEEEHEGDEEEQEEGEGNDRTGVTGKSKDSKKKAGLSTAGGAEARGRRKLSTDYDEDLSAKTAASLLAITSF